MASEGENGAEPKNGDGDANDSMYEVDDDELLKDNSAWADVTPIYPTDEEEGAVKIAVNEKCKFPSF